jgi:type I restriction enzyme S subunit
MELTKTKFKQTEIGLIPEDWELKLIDNVVKVSTGSKNTQDKISDGRYPFYVRSQTIERINSYSYDCEAVLTVGDGVGTGKVFHYVNQKFELHQRVYIMNEFANNLDGYYFYLFFSNNFYDRVMQMTAKSSVDSVRREMIANMKIPLPPLPEQKAITHVLSDTDNLIQAIEQKLAKKRAIKQGAMQQLLTPKEDWEVKKLGEILSSFQLGGNYPNTEKSTKSPLIKMGNLSRGYLTLKKLEYIPDIVEANKKDKLHRGDVLFNTRNTIDLVGKVAIYNNELPLGYFNWLCFRKLWNK